MNTKVIECEKKFKALQKESNELYKQIKPLLKQLKSLAKHCLKLADELDNDNSLYETFQVHGIDINGNNDFTRNVTCADGWNIDVIFRLNDLGSIVDDDVRKGSALDEIDAVLHNIKHAKFRRDQEQVGRNASI